MHDAPEPAAQPAYDGAAGAWRGERAARAVLKLSSFPTRIRLNLATLEISTRRHDGADSAQWLGRSNLKVRMRHATDDIKSVPQTKQLQPSRMRAVTSPLGGGSQAESLIPEHPGSESDRVDVRVSSPPAKFHCELGLAVAFPTWTSSSGVEALGPFRGNAALSGAAFRGCAVDAGALGNAARSATLAVHAVSAGTCAHLAACASLAARHRL